MPHSMQRRSPGNNYRNPGLYHITINVHDRRHQSLGKIVGDVQYPDGHPNAPKVELTTIGKMVEYELLHSITYHYPVIQIQDYVVMPEHMHFIVNVKNSIISKNGRQTHLGQIIAGFKNDNPCTLKPQRKTIDTLVTPNALRGYLIREHTLRQEDATIWQTIVERLLIDNSHIVCDSYGCRQILDHQLLPVVCHRKDKPSFIQQKQACLKAAANGAVLVSPRIAKGKQEIIDEAIAQGHPVILIVDNGFPEIYHPSELRLQQCVGNRLLLLTPWTYQYRPANEDITVPQCKTMNCIVQDICRTKDDWWKQE